MAKENLYITIPDNMATAICDEIRDLAAINKPLRSSEIAPAIPLIVTPNLSFTIEKVVE